jgi:hypothetical protein
LRLIVLALAGYRRPNTGVSLALVNRYTTTWLTEAAEKLARTYVPELSIVYSTACCSDQQSFIENGFPGMRCALSLSLFMCARVRVLSALLD